MARSNNKSPTFDIMPTAAKSGKPKHEKGMNKKILRNLAALAGPYMRKRVEARNDQNFDLQPHFEVPDSYPAEGSAALSFILTNQHKNLIRE